MAHSIQNAVKQAIQVILSVFILGTYSEKRLHDKDNISLQGVVINGEWPPWTVKRN